MGTLASVRDWVRDQIREVRHLSILATLPAKPAPVGHVDLDDMPLTESVPVCDWVYLPSGDHCWHAATVRIRTHLIYPVEPCPDMVAALVCDEHFEQWQAGWRLLLMLVCPWTCPSCGRQFTCLCDAIPTVIPL